MPTAYYLAPVVNDGQQPATWGSYLPVWDQTLPVCVVAYIPNAASGAPANNWCIIGVTADDQTPFASDPQLTPLPQIDQSAALTPAQVNAVKIAITKHSPSAVSLQAGQKLADAVAAIQGLLGTSVTPSAVQAGLG